MNNKFKNILIFGGFIIIVIVASIFMPQETVQITDEAALITNNNESEEMVEKNKIYVYIIGAVHEPGVKVAIEGMRLYQIIELSGGLTEDADISKINLAATVRDEQKIIIPNLSMSGEKTYSVTYDEYDGLININTASSEKLQELTGIGESTAKKIIAYREGNGEFKKIEDIKNVSGIGESKYNAIKNDITV